MDTVKQIKVIYCDLKRRGRGTPNNPIRVIREIYALNGDLMMQDDSEVQFTKEDMINFALQANKNLLDVNDVENAFEKWNKDRIPF